MIENEGEVNNTLKRLIDSIFSLDSEELSGAIELKTAAGSIRFKLIGGCLVDSSTDQGGWQLEEFLVQSGRLTREDLERAIRDRKEESKRLWEVIVEGGFISSDEVELAKYELAAQRFSMFLSLGFDEVDVQVKKVEEGERAGAGSQRLVPLLLEYLKVAHETGAISPVRVPGHVTLRPQPRIGVYREEIERILGHPLPLPAPGGEKVDSILDRCGPKAENKLSILLITDMLQTEFEDGVSIGGEKLRLPTISQILRRLITVTSHQIIDDQGADFRTAIELGNLLLEGFDAYQPSLKYFEMAGKMADDPAIGIERKIIIYLLGEIPLPSEVEKFAAKFSSLPLGRDTKSLVMRNLALYFFNRSDYASASRYLHEAFIYKPYEPENLEYFMQMFFRNPAIVSYKDAGAGLLDFTEGEYPDVLPLVFSCARENEQYSVISFLLREGLEKLKIGSDVFDMGIDLMKKLRWGADLVEFITFFSLSGEKKGWTNPLWSVGSLYINDKLEESIYFAQEAYEILVKTSSRKMWAISRLVELMEKIGLSNMLFALLGKSFAEAESYEDKLQFGEKLALMLCAEVGEMREAGAVAAAVAEINPVSGVAFDVVSRCFSSGKLTRRACYLYANTLLGRKEEGKRIPPIYFMKASSMVKQLLGDYLLMKRLLEAVVAYHPEAAEAIVVQKELSIIEDKIEQLKTRKEEIISALSSGVEDAGERKNLLLEMLTVMLSISEEGVRIAELIKENFVSGDIPWESASICVARWKDTEKLADFLRGILSGMEGGDVPSTNRGFSSFIEEVSQIIDEEGSGFPDDIKRSVFSTLIRLQPFNRRAIKYFQTSSADTGEIFDVIQMEERKIATATTHERGKLYLNLATYCDLAESSADRSETFWKIADSSMKKFPPVIFAMVEKQLQKGSYRDAADIIMANLPSIPRFLYFDLLDLSGKLYFLSGELDGFNDVVKKMVEYVPWHGGFLSSIAIAGPGGISERDVLQRLFEAVVKYHFLDEEMAGIVEEFFKMADAQEQMRNFVVQAFRILLDRIYPAGGIERESDRQSRISFFERTSEYLSKWEYYHDSARSLERAILLSSDEGRIAGLVVKLADVYCMMGLAGVEGLLLTMWRINQLEKVDRSKIGFDRYYDFLADKIALNVASEEKIEQLFGDASGEASPWGKLLVAGFYAEFLGNVEKGREVAQKCFRNNPEFIESGLYATSLGEKLGDWKSAVDLYLEIGQRISDKSIASKMYERAALISDVKLKDEAAGTDFLLRALEVLPENDNLFQEIESRAVMLKNKEMFVKAHEIVQPHLPGRQSQIAFYYRYAKILAEQFNDYNAASRALLQALSLSPKRGAVLEAIVHYACIMNSYEPVKEAVYMLHSAGMNRGEVSDVILASVDSFIKRGNFPSSYKLMSDCINLDPLFDIERGIEESKKVEGKDSPSARKILDKWIAILEEKIATKVEDQHYYKKLDRLSELRDSFEEAQEEEERFPAVSIPPPSIDIQWLEIEKDAKGLDEKKLFSTPEPIRRQEEIYDDLPKVIIDLPPEELEAIKNQSEKLNQEDVTAGTEEGKKVPSYPPSEAESIIDAIGKAEAKEPEVTISVPPSRSVYESVEVEVGGGDEEDTIREEADLEFEEAPTPAVEEPQRKMERSGEVNEEDVVRDKTVEIERLEGDKLIEKLMEFPWDFDVVKKGVEIGKGGFSMSSSLHVLKGLYSIIDSRGAGFSMREYMLVGKSDTSRKFSLLVATRALSDWVEIMKLLWENAPSLFCENLSDYGVNVGHQITPFSSGPVAPILERIIEAMGYIRASVYTKRERKMEFHVVRTNPPSVVIIVPPGKLPPSLEYEVAKHMWGAQPWNVLGFSLPDEKGESIVKAVAVGFGQMGGGQKDRVDPITSSIVQDLWKVLPTKVQERIKALMEGGEVHKISFSGLRQEVKAECMRAGFLFSGDIASAVRDGLPPDMFSSIDGDIPQGLISDAIKQSRQLQRLIRFSLSVETNILMEEFMKV